MSTSLVARPPEKTSDARSLVVNSLFGSGEGSPTELELNSAQPIPVHCDGFEGQLLFLHRPNPEPEDWLYAEHFRGCASRFEWRVQGRFTVDPGRNIHFGVEVSKHINLSWLLHTTVDGLLALIEKLSSARGHGFSYALEWEDREDGGVIKPHLAFPLHAADTLLVTPPDETPPDITKSFTETPLEERLRVRDEVLPGNTRDTVTFVYFSKYVDFMRWEICNLPFNFSSSFSTFIGEDAPVRVIVYRLESEDSLHTKERQQSMITVNMEYKLVGCPPDDQVDLCKHTDSDVQAHRDVEARESARRVD